MAEDKDKILLNQVIDKVEYTFTRDILVKPLPEEFIEKEVSEPVATGKKDKDGIDQYETKTEVKKVPTNFKKGIVLAIPTGYEWQDKDNHPEVGDLVAYPGKVTASFDLFKDSQLVNPYNVVAFIRRGA